MTYCFDVASTRKRDLGAIIYCWVSHTVKNIAKIRVPLHVHDTISISTLPTNSKRGIIIISISYFYFSSYLLLTPVERRRTYSYQLTVNSKIHLYSYDVLSSLPLQLRIRCLFKDSSYLLFARANSHQLMYEVSSIHTLHTV